MNLNFYPFSVIYPKYEDHEFSNAFHKGLVIAFFILLMIRAVGTGQPLSVVFSTPNTYVWICPSGVTSATIECWGGGGGGGGAMQGPNDTVGGGGGGGAYVIDTVSVIPNTNYTLFVASGGEGVPGANGNTGGSSWFNSTSTVLAVGGTGGFFGGAGAGGYGTGGPGGAAASCIPAANAITGSNGSDAFNNGSPASGAGGRAGGVMGGSGAKGVGGISGGNTLGAIGNDGKSPGGGGSGGLAGDVISSPFGGFGAAGQVVVSYTYANPVINFQAGKELNVKAFPNPTNGKTTIQFNSEASAGYTFKVFDITGRELINKKGKTEEGINYVGLDMNSYAKGIYMVLLQAADQDRIIKLILQ